MGLFITKKTGAYGGQKNTGDYVASPTTNQIRKARTRKDAVEISRVAYEAILPLLQIPKTEPKKEEKLDG